MPVRAGRTFSFIVMLVLRILVGKKSKRFSADGYVGCAAPIVSGFCVKCHAGRYPTQAKFPLAGSRCQPLAQHPFEVARVVGLQQAGFAREVKIP